MHRPKADQKAEISRTVTNTVIREAHWDVSSTVEQTVSYQIGSDAVDGKVGGGTSLSFTAGYGESTGSSESVEVGLSAGVETVVFDGWWSLQPCVLLGTATRLYT